MAAFRYISVDGFVSLIYYYVYHFPKNFVPFVVVRNHVGARKGS